MLYEYAYYRATSRQTQSVRNLKRENNGKTRISESKLKTLLIMEQTRHEQKQEGSQTNKVDCVSL